MGSVRGGSFAVHPGNAFDVLQAVGRQITNDLEEALAHEALGAADQQRRRVGRLVAADPFADPVECLDRVVAVVDGAAAGLPGCRRRATFGDRAVGRQVGAANGPQLRQLRVLTQHLAQAAEAQRGGADLSSAGVVAEGGAAPVARPSGGGAINNREDAIKALDRVCDWINRNEPTNPAPLLIRRAQRLMGKSFLEIIRDLAPDGLKDVERIAGVDSE